MNNVIKIKWTGAAGLEINYGDKTLLIDPFYSRIRRYKMLFGRISPDLSKIKKACENMGEVTAIISGHTHFDHALDIHTFHSFLNCRVVGGKNLDSLFRRYGSEGVVNICYGNEKIQIDENMLVKMIPSGHGKVLFKRVPFMGDIDPSGPLPMKAKDYKVSYVFNPLIEINEKSFLHVGSAGYKDDEVEKVNCDTLFLCVPGWNNKKEYPEKIIDSVKPENVVLFHFDDFLTDQQRALKKISGIKMDKLIHVIRSSFPSLNIITPDLFEDMIF